jgi:hypothetical protein
MPLEIGEGVPGSGMEGAGVERVKVVAKPQ